MLRERNMLLERDMKIKTRSIDKVRRPPSSAFSLLLLPAAALAAALIAPCAQSTGVIAGLREKMKENESAAKREERLAKENGVLKDQIRELRGALSAQVADSDTRFRELLTRMEAMREREREIKTHMYAVQAVVDARESISRLMATGAGELDGREWVVFTIKVLTGNRKGAATRANVSISMLGTDDRTEPLELQNSIDNFQRGKEDEFVMHLMDIGDVKEITIGHDNTGPPGTAGWFCEKVTVINEATGKEHEFECGRWLDEKQDDGKIERKLRAGTNDSDIAKYTILVLTGDKRGSGTDANVYMTLFGSNGDSGKRELESGKNDFERGQDDKFEFECPDLGALKEIRIGHDDSGVGPGWLCDRILVTKEGAAPVEFPVYQWFDKSSGDNLIERTVQPGTGGPAEEALYTVTTKTGDCRGAGTDANVTINIFGTNGDSGDVPLESGANNFERDAREEFILSLTDLGKITKVRITQDGSGMGSAWFLESVSVLDKNTQVSYDFLCSRWLNDTEGLFVDLAPGGEPPPKPAVYTVTTYTGGGRGMGTDANVTLQMFGPGNEASPELKLESGSDDFERGAVNVFTCPSPPVGDIQRIRIGHDNSGVGAGWFLEKVLIEGKEGVSGRWEFICGRWLSDSEDDHAYSRDLLAGGVDPRDALVKYEVDVTTADQRGCGTDANVTLIIFGSQGDTGEKSLESGQDDFERGKTDHFVCESIDIGEIQRIRLTSDGSGMGSDWLCESVNITNPKTQLKTSFNPSQWFRKAEGLQHEFEAGAEPVQMAKYRVVVQTANTRGAGTDANVFINLIGEEGESGDKILESGQNDFERGEANEFVLEVPEMGKLKSIKIGHDNSGPGAGWKLDTVFVENMMDPAEQINFEAYRWLDKNQDDGATSLAISAVPLLGPDGKPVRHLVTWTVLVKTTDERGAGSDAAVFVKLIGETGVSENITLESGANDFERGETNEFKIQTKDIGRLTKIRIGHDGKGFGAGWHMDSAEIIDDGTRESWKFPCHRWFDEDQDDGLIVRELVPGSLDGAASADGKVFYEIEVHTGTIRGAGTDANVEIEIIGDTDFTGKMKLENSRDNFEKGKVDLFKMSMIDVGELQKIRIGHDNKGMGGAWFLDKVVIKKSNAEDVWEFGCNRWLAKDEDDGQCVRELVPGNAAPLLKYHVNVITGDVRGAGTDAAVTIVLYGAPDPATRRARDSGERVLETGKDNFERNKQDLFIVECQDLGGVEKVRIGHDGTGLGAGWFLGAVEVWEEGKEDQKLTLKCERWLDTSEDDGAIVRVLTKDSFNDVKYTSYLVSVYTGSIRGAGTNANISINIYGDRDGGSQSGDLRLESGRSAFEKGRKDDFRLRLPTLTSDGPDGAIQKIRIGHDGKGIGAGWYLDKVIIQDMTVEAAGQHQQWHFPAYRWLDEGEGDNQLAVVIDATDESYEHSGKPNTYTVTTVTGNRRGAGTSANVFVDLVGDSGESGRLALEGVRSSFERGGRDEFRVSTPSVGAMQKIRIGHDSKGTSSGWFCEKVLVKDDATGEMWAFPIYRWLDTKPDPTNPDGQTIVEMVPTSGDVSDENAADFFKLEVITGDRRGAGTDANVSIELVGTKGTSGTKKLDASKSDFERGNHDVFPIECATAIGPLTKIRIGHDNAGWSPAWFLERVQIVNERTGEQYSFGCNKWFDKKGDKDGDNQIIRELLPGDSNEATQMTTYSVRVKTSDVRGAGTSARVFINITGELGDTGDRLLDASRSNFSRDGQDEFLIEAVNCGELQKVRIGHDNKGLAPGWHLDTVEVSVVKGEGSDAGIGPWKFPCGRWLAKDEEDGQIILELVPEGDGAEGAAAGVSYTIEVHTKDVSRAGTDANVHITVYGENGNTGSRKLSNKWKNNFERGQIDKFQIAAADLGKLSSVRIGHDGSGRGAGWYLEQVVVQREGAESGTEFPCDRWLDINEDDGLTERELYPADSGRSTARVAQTQEGLVVYNVSILTGDKTGAGTDAKIKLVLTGDQGTSGVRWIANGRGKFERGSGPDGPWDHTTIEAADLGEITKVLLGHDDKGAFSGWYCEELVVQHSVTEQEWRFPVNRWFDRDEEDGQVERELAYVADRGANEDYNVAVTTMDEKGAGTNADVYVELIGELGTSGRRTLDKSVLKPGTKKFFGSIFEKGQTNEFMLNLPKLGDIKHVVVGHNGEGMGAGWRMTEVKVTDKDGKEFTFPNKENDGWLDRKEGDTKIERRLTEVGHESSGSLHLGRETTYSVSVFTGTASGSGTNSKVFVTIFGEAGDTGERQLPSKRSSFENGNVDVFQVSAVELGQLLRLRVRHDGTGMGAGWFLDHIDVRSELTGNGWSFPCNKWLDTNEADGLIQRDLDAEPMA